MANWCINRVEFVGEHNQFEYLQLLFEAMAAKGIRENRGQLPAFLKNDSGFFFQTEWIDGILYYQTKWSPNTATLVKVSDYFGADFIHSYSETGNLICGEASYKNGVLTDISLDSTDFDQYQFDDELEIYLFEGEEYGDSDEILEILLERKKALNALQQ